ncbi:MFS quinate transporter QutD [Aureobasidium sp. EXF-10728]|nr:MFS quinate transporter QutD [Aureobasidium sp. EXF-10728]
MGGLHAVEDRPTPKEVYNWRLYTEALIIATGSLLFGYDSAFVGTTIARASFKSDFGITKATAAGISSNITSAFQAGAFFGALFCYFLTERVGRKWTLQANVVVFIVGAVLMTVATHQLSFIYAGRVLTGLGCGAITATVPSYIAELSVPSIRGILTGLFEIAYQIGSLIGFWVNYGINNNMNVKSSLSWRIPMAIQLIPAAILLVGSLFLHESPLWLMRKGRETDAKAALVQLRHLPVEHEYLQEDVQDMQNRLNEEAAIAARYGNGSFAFIRGCLNELSRPGMRNRVLLVFCAFALQNLSGASAINYYSPTLFGSLGVADIPLYTGIYGLVKAIASIIYYIFFIDVLGRRNPVLVSSAACSFCLWFVGAYVKVGHPADAIAAGVPLSASTAAGGRAAIGMIMIYSVFWSFGLNGIPWIVSAEIFPGSLRVLTGTSFGYGTWFFFAAWMLIATLWTYFFMPETKGLTIDQMDALFGYHGRARADDAEIGVSYKQGVDSVEKIGATTTDQYKSQILVEVLCQGRSADKGKGKPRSEVYVPSPQLVGLRRNISRYERPASARQEQHRVATGQVTTWMFDVQEEEGAQSGSGDTNATRIPAGATSQAALNEPAWPLPTVHDSVATSTSPATTQDPPAVDNFFDYAGFMWDNAEWWQQFQPSDVLLPNDQVDQTISDLFSSPSTNSPSFAAVNETHQSGSVVTHRSQIQGKQAERAQDSIETTQTGNQFLLDYFVHSTVPPILAPVETQQQWASMRRHLVFMAQESSMVRSALLSFSDLLVRRRRQNITTSTEGQARHQESACGLSKYTENFESGQPEREHLLATCFFLSYVDILEGRTQAAHGSLKVAYHIFDKGDKATFGPLEIRILSWIRLLDGRAVSAGGEGLFLSDDEATEMLVQPSPAGLDCLPSGTDVMNDADQGAEIEDALFQALYQPGAVFFQKVQSFMGRISKIDPWHRSRGTVADETEVMVVAAKITRDLEKLFANRPRLMDYAAKGQLTPQYLSPHLSHAITRAFRTYASNFYASKVHLHRVAYKTLPLAMDTVLALAKIKELARMMADTPSRPGIEGGEPLPVNMLWPLLMLGSEEEDPQERVWIRDQICRMQEVATNAEMTARVLDEVQKMQDSTGTRVDIRSIMHKIFDACFAIV